MTWLGLIAMLILSLNLPAQSKESTMAQHVAYRTVKVDGLSIFYREAGPKEAPTLLLLHRLPSSSRMFEPLLTRLAGEFHMWQAWMQMTQPRLLVLWGNYDLSFELTEPEAYRRDVPKAQVHILDAGHFALDTAADEIAELVRSFVGSLG